MRDRRVAHQLPTLARISATVRRIAVGVLLLQLAGCGGGEADVVPPPVLPDAVRGVSVSPASASVIVGQSLTLVPTPDAAAASVAVTIVFASATPAVATVSFGGVVTGITPGTATITVTATGIAAGFTTTSKTTTATITVLPVPLPDALRGLSLPPSGNVSVGQTFTLAPVPDAAAPSVLVSTAYASASPSVATVSLQGVVTGVSVGTAVLTVTATGSGSGFTTTTKSATTTITVIPAPDALRGVTLSPSGTSVLVGQTIPLVVVRDVAASRVVVTNSFVSSAPSVATVSASGVVTGISAGTAVVTVTATGSSVGFTTATKTATATITVAPAPDALRSIRLAPLTGSIVVGGTLALTTIPDAAAASVNVSNAFTSSAQAVATVSASGVVTGVAVGTTIITVTSTGSGTGFTSSIRTATATVTVVAGPDALRSLSVSASNSTVLVGRTIALTPVPDLAAPTVTVSVTYASSANAIATVSAAGIVTGVSEGTAVITLTATGTGNGYSTSTKVATASIAVRLLDAISALTVTPPSVTLQLAKVQALVVVPQVASSDVAVIIGFSSSDPSVATVSTAGEVQGIGIGTATITVTATGSGVNTKPSTVSAAVPVRVIPTGFAVPLFPLIPSGTFLMGTPSGGAANERPTHIVTVSAFRMLRGEVTQAQWRSIMGANPSRFTACGDDCPVERVSWDDVQTFLSRLNAVDPGNGYRLPTEAEWEYAARAGTTGEYGGTGVLTDMGWYFGNSGNTTHPGLLKRANAWGLYDMHGNVFEWVQDWLGAYTDAAQTNPTGPVTGSTRVLRGGGWESDADVARSAGRIGIAPSTRLDGFGFRLVRNP